MSHPNPPTTIAIIPAFNEAETLAQVIDDVRLYVHGIIVVDDGSSDTTFRIAKNAGVVVIRHTKNKGYGTSMEDGFREAVRRGAAILLTFDADGQHSAKDIPTILQPILKGEAQVSIGQRTNHKKHFAETLFALYTHIRFRIPDPLCGLKAYRREVYQYVGHFDTIQSIGTQLALEAVLNGFSFRMIPVSIGRRKDSSRFYAHNLRANWKIMKALWRTLFLKKNHD